MTVYVKENDDDLLWSKLLTAARRRSPQLCRNLEGFQAEGTQIVKLKNGNFALRPVIVGSAGSENFDDGCPGCPGWRDEGDYRRYAKKFLSPHHNLLVELLAGLKAESQATLL